MNLLLININIKTGNMTLFRVTDIDLKLFRFIFIDSDLSFAKSPPPVNIIIALVIAFIDSAMWFAILNIPASTNPKLYAKNGVKKLPEKKFLPMCVE